MSLHAEQEREISRRRPGASWCRRWKKPLPVLAGARSRLRRVVDCVGDDRAIVQAARISHGRGTRTVSDDRGRINYPMRMRHTTPFEICELKLHVKLPIFVARQWIRHRIANINEYSALLLLEDCFYPPEREHIAAHSASNQQGRGEVLEGPRRRTRCATQAYERCLRLLVSNPAASRA